MEVQTGDETRSLRIQMDARGHHARHNSLPTFPIAVGLSAGDQITGDPVDSLRPHSAREANGLENENEPNVEDFRNQSPRQTFSEGTRPCSLQLASEVRKLVDGQINLLRLLNWSLEVEMPIGTGPAPHMHQHPSERDYSLAEDVAQKYWNNLMPTDGKIANAVNLFLGKVTDDDRYNLRIRPYNGPKAEIVYKWLNDGVEEDAWIIDIRWWDPWNDRPCYGGHVCTDAANTERAIRDGWPIALPKELYEWPSMRAGGDMSAVPPLMSHVSLFFLLSLSLTDL